MSDKVIVELTRRQLDILIFGLTNSPFPINHQEDAWQLVLKLRDKIRETQLG